MMKSKEPIVTKSAKNLNVPREFVAKCIAGGWLESPQQGLVALTARSIAELKPYFQGF